ncbi:Phosphatidylinositol 4-kinase pik1alpha (PI4-kinase)(PtdIns-4-kinase) [Saitoella coloradoensis]
MSSGKSSYSPLPPPPSYHWINPNTLPALLLRFFQSTHFNSFLCVAYLSRYATSPGIAYYLCTRLRGFNNEEIEFFLPQLCHLLISEDVDIHALEDFIVDLCERSVHFALSTFWLLQAHLIDLALMPNTPSFRRCRRIFNTVQTIVFRDAAPPTSTKKEKIKEHPLPASFLAGLMMGAVGMPLLPGLGGPPAMMQAREERLYSANETSSETPRSRASTESLPPSDPTPWGEERITQIQHAPTAPARMSSPLSRAHSPIVGDELDFSTPRKPWSSLRPPLRHAAASSSSPNVNRSLSYASMRSASSTSISNHKKNQAHFEGILYSEYFRSENQLLLALQNISAKLVPVPKSARLSALRTELALINTDLPAMVCIPCMCSATPASPVHHRVVRINPAEATVLNSAERVPFLIMVEVLEDDMDFDGSSAKNRKEVQKIMQNGGQNRRRLFDLSQLNEGDLLKSAVDTSATEMSNEPIESDYGDIGISPLHQTEAAREAMFRNVVIGGPSRDRSYSAADIFDPVSAKSSTTSLSRASLGTYALSDDRPADAMNLSSIATRMRAAATMLSQLDAGGGKRPRAETAAIKAKIVAEMESLFPEGMEASLVVADGGRLENDLNKQGGAGVAKQITKEDPSAALFGEDWTKKKERIRAASPYGHLPNWDVFSVIVKTGADLRQEAFACQLIEACQRIWQDAEVGVWIRKMRIMVTGNDGGLIETVTNAISVHSIKKTLATVAAATQPGKIISLKDHYVKTFGEPGTETYVAAQDAFLKSLAAYSVISYILQLKDRHNGNILCDNEGHVIHIDFGFMLGSSPGNVGFEAAPFKFTQEYIDILEGPTSDAYKKFVQCMKSAFKALRKRADDFVSMVEMMQRNSHMACINGPATSAALRQRFVLHLSEAEVDDFVEGLVTKSGNSVWSRLYDQFQFLSQGVY